MPNEIIEKAIQEIASSHRKIIDDWCKAYMAQLYEENGSIKPGDFILYEQEGRDCMVKKYWFEPKDQEEKEQKQEGA